MLNKTKQEEEVVEVVLNTEAMTDRMELEEVIEVEEKKDMEEEAKELKQK